MISIHAAREGGDTPERQRFTIAHISIHAAREGGDFIQGLLALIGVISIHAAREGGDRSGRRSAKQGYNFNPRRP